MACTLDTDLTWLLHQAANRLREAVDAVAREQGSAGVRDFIVLGALIHLSPRTQQELGDAVGLDKTTLTSLIDRLEREGLVVRKIDPENRRARTPEITTAGKALHAAIDRARETEELRLLEGMNKTEVKALRKLLLHLAGAA